MENSNIFRAIAIVLHVVFRLEQVTLNFAQSPIGVITRSITSKVL
ncbi:hypothetical protein BAZMOX_02905_3 [methanotrophic endosymbiont of Bathymodiolus azoricus (Menez Gwen)]|nr:hypothetical protein BAZMOX_02905_3 [methanotrophic endosymbiont of Bathymodiolus azoricus (Menez Gwen)]